jgi:hypothetical protein
MLRRCHKLFWIVLAICFVSVYGALVWQSSHAPQSPSHQAATKNEHKTNTQTIEERHQATEEAIANYNLWIMAFTGVLAFATAGLGAMNFFQLRLARAEYISSHYPRIILRDAYLVGETIHYTLVNIGSTPAKVIESWIFAEFVEQGTRLRPLFPTNHYDFGRHSGFVAGESKELQYTLPPEVSFAIKWPATRKIGINGQPPIFGERYFVGVVTYTDDLGVKRRSIFRRRWDDASLTFVRLTPEQERDHEYTD